jgi:hypothetical protein
MHVEAAAEVAVPRPVLNVLAAVDDRPRPRLLDVSALTGHRSLTSPAARHPNGRDVAITNRLAFSLDVVGTRSNPWIVTRLGTAFEAARDRGSKS